MGRRTTTGVNLESPRFSTPVEWRRPGTLIIESAVLYPGTGSKLNFSESEINAAKYMQGMGNDVLLRMPRRTRAEGGTSDLLMNGINYNVYTPETSNLNRIISGLAKKNSQTTGLVLDLSRSTVASEQLGDVLKRAHGAGAQNIKDIVIMLKNSYA